MTPRRSSMMGDVRSFLRAAQVYIPGGSDTKYAGQRAVRRILRRPFERDFRALPSCVNVRHGLAVDVGANRGQSIDAIRLTLGDIGIASFEPNPWLVGKLRDRYRSAGVSIYEYGLSDTAGSFELYVPFYRGYMYDGLASLDREEAAGWLRERLHKFDEKALDVRETRVEVATLDSFALNADFIKIDVQGVEAAVLRGARETLGRCRPVLLVEAPEHDVQEVLDSFGYRPWHYADGRLSEGPGSETNTFFLAGPE